MTVYDRRLAPAMIGSVAVHLLAAATLLFLAPVCRRPCARLRRHSIRSSGCPSRDRAAEAGAADTTIRVRRASRTSAAKTRRPSMRLGQPVRVFVTLEIDFVLR